MDEPPIHDWAISRRGFLKSAFAAAAGSALLPLCCVPDARSIAGQQPVRFGIVADCHYADSEPVGARFYRESLDKLSECVARMNEEKVDFLIELGDLKDQDKRPVESKTLEYLDRIEAIFQQFNGPTYHVLGNHDMDSISKKQFLSRVENTDIQTDRTYYSFDLKHLHFIVLDANYKADGADYDHGNFDWTDANILGHELDWLKQDLASARGPVVVFVHQLLDGTGSPYVKNAAVVRQILDQSRKVLAVFQGHHHPGQYNNIGAIHYYTLRAAVEGHGEENNSYAIVEIRPDLGLIITGYRKAIGKEFAYSPAAQIRQAGRALPAG